jgi:hypothetical protein
MERKVGFLSKLSRVLYDFTNLKLSRVLHDFTNLNLIGGYFNSIQNYSKKNKPVTLGHWSFVSSAMLEHTGLGEIKIY